MAIFDRPFATGDRLAHGRGAGRRARAHPFADERPPGAETGGRAAEMTRAVTDYEKAKHVVLADIAAARANLATVRRAAGLLDKRLAVSNEQFELSRKSVAPSEIGAWTSTVFGNRSSTRSGRRRPLPS
jgi:outer membrane protein, heavy metal efflux system